MNKDVLVETLAVSMDSAQLRSTARTLLHLADCLEDNVDTNESQKPIFRWPNILSKIEKDQFNLSIVAKFIYDKRLKRNKFLPPTLFGEPAWDMLLDLFMQDTGGKRISTQSLCLASNSPATTALRYIDLLEKESLVRRIKSNADKRVVFIELTDAGKTAIGGYLLDHPDYENNIFAGERR